MISDREWKRFIDGKRNPNIIAYFTAFNLDEAGARRCFNKAAENKSLSPQTIKKYNQRLVNGFLTAYLIPIITTTILPYSLVSIALSIVIMGAGITSMYDTVFLKKDRLRKQAVKSSIEEQAQKYQKDKKENPNALPIKVW